MINKNDEILFKTIIDKRTSDEFLRKIEHESSVLWYFSGLSPTSFNPFKHPNNCYNSLYLILKKKDENIFLSFGIIDNILDLDDDEKYLRNKSFLEICSELCPKIKEEKMEDDIIMQTIIGKEKWNEFAEEITNNTSIKWTSNKRLTEYNPFEDFEHGNTFINENGKLFCLVNLVTLKETIQNEIGIEVIGIENIDGYNLISNEEFLNICKENYPKKIHFCTYVLKEEWKNFIEILDKITNGKEFIIGKRRLFGPSVEVNKYIKKQASYFNYFSPFNKIRSNLIGEYNMTIDTPSGIFIHYELDGEKEKLYTTKSIDSFTNDNRKETLEFLALCSKLK